MDRTLGSPEGAWRSEELRKPRPLFSGTKNQRERGRTRARDLRHVRGRVGRPPRAGVDRAPRGSGVRARSSTIPRVSVSPSFRGRGRGHRVVLVRCVLEPRDGSRAFHELRPVHAPRGRRVQHHDRTRGLRPRRREGGEQARHAARVRPGRGPPRAPRRLHRRSRERTSLYTLRGPLRLWHRRPPRARPAPRRGRVPDRRARLPGGRAPRGARARTRGDTPRPRRGRGGRTT